MYAEPLHVALLCESCGYPLVGASEAAACPECGTGVRASLPASRPGSAWQRGERFGLARTLSTFVFEPGAGYRLVTIESRRSRRLLVVTTGIAGVLAASPWLALAALQIVTSIAWRAVWQTLGWWVVGGVGMWILMLVGSWIEGLGIRFFGGRRGWRISREVSAAVRGHAAVGWVGGGVVAAGFSVLGLLLALSDGDGMVVAITGVIGVGLGALLGLLWFEILVYTGVRVCRFANPPGATLAASQPADAGAVSQSAPGAGRAPRGE
jgi:hypothetical protein